MTSFLRLRSVSLRCIPWFIATASLVGCAGPSVRSEIQPLETSSSLVQQDDARVAVVLDHVVIRNGAGAWADDAAWDEYRFRLRSRSGDEVRLVRITLVDALGEAVESSADRGRLIDTTDEIEKRYQASGKLVRSESGGEWKLAAGSATAVAIGGAWGASLGGGLISSTAVAGIGAGVVGVAFLAGAGVVKVVRDARVASQLESRQTLLPVLLGIEDTRVVAFFPIVPLPSAVEVFYLAGNAEHRIRFAMP
jgi:hypothetical protein